MNEKKVVLHLEIEIEELEQKTAPDSGQLPGY